MLLSYSSDQAILGVGLVEIVLFQRFLKFSGLSMMSILLTLLMLSRLSSLPKIFNIVQVVEIVEIVLFQRLQFAVEVFVALEPISNSIVPLSCLFNIFKISFGHLQGGSSILRHIC